MILILNKEEDEIFKTSNDIIAIIICVFRVVLIGPVLGDYFSLWAINTQHSKLESVCCNDRVMQTPGPRALSSDRASCHQEPVSITGDMRNGQISSNELLW